MNSTGRELWLAQLSHGPNGAVADTLVEAKAAFRAAGSGREAIASPVIGPENNKIIRRCASEAGWLLWRGNYGGQSQTINHSIDRA
jgi:hypothetical protein